MESVSFKLPKDVVARLEMLARDDDVSVGQIIRLALERDFHRRESLKSHPRTEERLLAPIRAQALDAFLAATDWGDLKVRLLDKGYCLREAGGGLALHDAVTGRFLCRSSEIGFGYPTLLRRFKGAFPGHSHTWLLDRIRDVPVYVRSHRRQGSPHLMAMGLGNPDPVMSGRTCHHGNCLMRLLRKKR